MVDSFTRKFLLDVSRRLAGAIITFSLFSFSDSLGGPMVNDIELRLSAMRNAFLLHASNWLKKHDTSLYCTILYFILYFTLLYYTLLYFTEVPDTSVDQTYILYCTLLYYTQYPSFEFFDNLVSLSSTMWHDWTSLSVTWISSAKRCVIIDLRRSGMAKLLCPCAHLVGREAACASNCFNRKLYLSIHWINNGKYKTNK